MKINLRGRRAYLYRRRWVPAGPDVPHAHPAEDYLGAIDAEAETIPPELLTVLTAAEQAQLQEKVLLPAAQARAAAAKHLSKVPAAPGLTVCGQSSTGLLKGMKAVCSGRCRRRGL